jgi:hypothetical protein
MDALPEFPAKKYANINNCPASMHVTTTASLTKAFKEVHFSLYVHVHVEVVNLKATKKKCNGAHEVALRTHVQAVI